MGFRAVNEMSHFSFEDCVVVKMYKREKQLCLEVEALIVTPNNSQNQQLTSSYADTSIITFSDALVIAGVKDGIRRYTADDELIEEIPDQILSEQEIDMLLAHLDGTYLYAVEQLDSLENTELSQNRDVYVLGIDCSENTIESQIEAPSYQIKISCSGVSCTWEKYMNRVQK